jgi:hypothetical protein
MLADLVEQETITTGTAAYTVSGAVDFRRTFAAALATNDVIPYVVVGSDGTYECGYGTWNEGAGTLARTTITSGSNGTSAVNWAAGTKRIYLATHSASPIGAIRHNMANVAAPTANDDANDGYAVGSLWLHQSALHVCTSATAGSATWVRYFGYTVSDTTPTSRFRGALTDDNNNATDYFHSGINYNGGYSFAVSNAYGDGGDGGMAAFTTDATPTKMAYKGDYATHGSIYCEGASCLTLIGMVSAIDNTSGDIKSWKVEAVVKTTSAGTTTIVAGGTPTELYEDAGATSWSIAVVGGSYECAIEVTGEAATSITWSFAGKLAAAIYY